MPKYKLTYFNARGRAELARFIFAVAGQEYEDFRFEHAEWPNYKASTPFGKAPVLEIDGVAICQSKTIARYLAKEFGLAGETNLEQAQADLLVETLHDDLLDMMIPLFKEPNETKKAELSKQFTEEYYPNLLTTLQTRLTENGGEFFVGKSLTWADLAVVDALGWIKALDMDTSLDKYPVLKKHQENIIAIPKLAEWLKNRPDTPR